MAKQNRISKLTWVYISGIASLFFLILAIVMIVLAPEITGAGITKSIYYILLIPVGLASAAFLFGALRSGAKYSGKTSYGTIELTGPVVIFCLVVIGGFYFATPESEFLLTIRAKDINQPEKVINYGSLILDIGEQRLNKNLNENGEISIPGIPYKFIGKNINIIPNISGYKLVSNSSIQIPDSRIIYLELEERRDTTLLRGRVISESNSTLDSVQIDIENGLVTTITDSNGLFSVNVPAGVGQTVLVTAIKNGTIGYREYINIPKNGSIEIKFVINQ